MGYRGRGSRGYYPGNGPFRDLPPWQRPGWVYGAGALKNESIDSNSCARFPWLARRWWINPEVNTGVLVPPAEQSKSIIEKEITAAENHIATLRKKLNEIESGEKQVNVG
jgi:hypothetical protein